MKFQIPWLKTNPQEELSEIETKLDSVLKPVSPDPVFVKSLRESLLRTSRMPNKTKKEENAGILQNTILISLGVLSASVMVISGIRGLIAFLSALGLLHQIKKMGDGEKSAAFKTVENS